MTSGGQFRSSHRWTNLTRLLSHLSSRVKLSGPTHRPTRRDSPPPGSPDVEISERKAPSGGRGQGEKEKRKGVMKKVYPGGKIYALRTRENLLRNRPFPGLRRQERAHCVSKRETGLPTGDSAPDFCGGNPAAPQVSLRDRRRRISGAPPQARGLPSRREEPGGAHGRPGPAAVPPGSQALKIRLTASSTMSSSASSGRVTFMPFSAFMASRTA